MYFTLSCQDPNSDARQELYYLLVNCFCRADVHKQGKVRADSFDTLVEEAVTLPRVHGYAPQTNVLYPTLAERKSARAKLFAAVSTIKTSCCLANKIPNQRGPFSD